MERMNTSKKRKVMKCDVYISEKLANLIFLLNIHTITVTTVYRSPKYSYIKQLHTIINQFDNHLVFIPSSLITISGL